MTSKRKYEAGKVYKFNAHNKIERFKVSYVGKKRVFLRSDEYNNDGNWYAELKDKDIYPKVWRCG